MLQFGGLLGDYFIPIHIFTHSHKLDKHGSSLLANTYSKLFLELGIVSGTQILYVLQERLLVDGPDREKYTESEEHSQRDAAKTTLQQCAIFCKFILGYNVYCDTEQ